jgi:carboxylesterase type B
VKNGGSYHSSEVPLIFGTSEKAFKGKETEEQKKLGRQMRTAWTSFAKDPDNGLEKLGWPLYSVKSEFFQFLSGEPALMHITIQEKSPRFLEAANGGAPI